MQITGLRIPNHAGSIAAIRNCVPSYTIYDVIFQQLVTPATSLTRQRLIYFSPVLNGGVCPKKKITGKQQV